MEMLALVLSPSHWFILAIVFLIVFGSKRLPDLARNMGKSLGILKKAKREFEEELMKSQAPEAPAPSALPEEMKAQAKTTDAQQEEDSPKLQA